MKCTDYVRNVKIDRGTPRLESRRSAWNHSIPENLQNRFWDSVIWIKIQTQRSRWFWSPQIAYIRFWSECCDRMWGPSRRRLNLHPQLCTWFEILSTSISSPVRNGHGSTITYLSFFLPASSRWLRTSDPSSRHLQPASSTSERLQMQQIGMSEHCPSEQLAETLLQLRFFDIGGSKEKILITRKGAARSLPVIW